MSRLISYRDALREAMQESMRLDERVIVLGLGVDDPAAIFGTTKGLREEFGPSRVYDIPISESAISGVAIGAAMAGLRPIVAHLRAEFSMLAMEQVANQAAKWHFLYGEEAVVPLVIRMIIGRGWGQSPQHAQNVQAWFAHIPGVKVIAPATPEDAKGLLTAAIQDNCPVISIEHRWLYDLTGDVPDGHFSLPLGQPRVLLAGNDISIVASSYMTLEACRAARLLKSMGVDAEVIDVRSLVPLNLRTIVESTKRTGRLLVCDHATRTSGYAAELVSSIVERVSLSKPPVRITLPDAPVPATRSLANFYYPRHTEIVAAAMHLLERPYVPDLVSQDAKLDVFDPTTAFFETEDEIARK